MRFQHHTPLVREQHTVTLRSRRPHRRTFGTVQHSELNHRVVGHNARIAAQSINFAHDLPFCHAAHRWIARHLSNSLHIHRDQQDF